jgi:hypothetical protein
MNASSSTVNPETSAISAHVIEKNELFLKNGFKIHIGMNYQDIRCGRNGIGDTKKRIKVPHSNHKKRLQFENKLI